MRVHVILQARMGSTRLPGKVLAPLAGEPMLAWIAKRVAHAAEPDGFCVATTDLPEDDPVYDYCRGSLGCACFRGSSEDVLGRYRECAAQLDSDVIVRITGDNPLVDPAVIDAAVCWYRSREGADYARYRAGLPLGIGVEVFSRKALERAYAEADDPECREHVTPYFYRNPQLFRVESAPLEGPDCSGFRLTVDTWEDRETLQAVLGALSGRDCPSWQDAVAYLRQNPGLASNAGVRQKSVSYAGEGMRHGS